MQRPEAHHKARLTSALSEELRSRNGGGGGAAYMAPSLSYFIPDTQHLPVLDTSFPLTSTELQFVHKFGFFLSDTHGQRHSENTAC